MTDKPNREIALDAVKRVGSFSEGEKDALIKAFRTSMFPGNWSTANPSDGDTLVYNSTTDAWDFAPAGVGDLTADGTTPLTADWNVGAFDITAVDLKATGRVYAGNTTLTIDDLFYMGAGSANLPAIFYDTGDYLGYDRPANAYDFVIGGNSQLALSATAADFFDNNITTTGVLTAGSISCNGKYVSTSNGNIDIEPHGTGNVLLGNFAFNADQTVGAGQDNYVLTYDNGTGLINLEASVSGFADPMTTRGDLIYKNAANATVRLPAGTANQVLTSDGTDISWQPSVAGTTVFTGLTDTPSTYVGQANKFLRVNAGATAVEFTSATPVTQVTGTSPVVSSGGTTPAISIPAATSGAHGYMTSTYAAKLDGIEAGADVTDATNVAAAGAYMKTVTISTSAPSGGADGDVWYQVV